MSTRLFKTLGVLAICLLISVACTSGRSSGGAGDGGQPASGDGDYPAPDAAAPSDDDYPGPRMPDVEIDSPYPGGDEDAATDEDSADAPSDADSGGAAMGSDIPSGWMMYSNDSAGFEIAHPADWTVEDLAPENNGAMQGVALTGPQGGVELRWGTGFGGACPDGYDTVATGAGDLQTCHIVADDGTEEWNQITTELANGDTFSGRAFTTDSSDDARQTILAVLSTLDFAE